MYLSWVGIIRIQPARDSTQQSCTLKLWCSSSIGSALSSATIGPKPMMECVVAISMFVGVGKITQLFWGLAYFYPTSTPRHLETRPHSLVLFQPFLPPTIFLQLSLRVGGLR